MVCYSDSHTLSRSPARGWLSYPKLPREILQRIGDGEGEGVRHNSEFDGEASSGLAVDLNLDLRTVFGGALQRARFEELDVPGTAEFSGPDERQVGHVAPGAARGNECQLKFRLQEVCFGGYFKWSPVVLGAPHDYQ